MTTRLTSRSSQGAVCRANSSRRAPTSYPGRMLQKRGIRRIAVLATVAGALALPAAASADDQSVYNSFHFSHPRFKQLRRDFEHGERRWENSGYQDPSEANRACRRTVDLSHKVVDKMQAKHTSTDLGRSA